ncbi:MAG: hypothetical protein JXO72_02890, partial [Vicinamibacteria bacterium]|nr:hypothetical protein [Vicinamibacteria bacterium]
PCEQKCINEAKVCKAKASNSLDSCRMQAQYFLSNCCDANNGGGRYPCPYTCPTAGVELECWCYTDNECFTEGDRILTTCEHMYKVNVVNCTVGYQKCVATYCSQ